MALERVVRAGRGFVFTSDELKSDPLAIPSYGLETDSVLCQQTQAHAALESVR